METKLPIPIKPHLERYLRVHLEGVNSEQIRIDATSDLGAFLMSFAKVSDKPLKKNPRLTYVELIIPSRDEQCHGYDGRYRFLSVNDQAVNRFNRFLDWLMKKELYDRLALIEERGENRQRNGKQRHEIDKFIKKYSTPGAELTYEALKKGYQRYKSEGKILVDQLV